MSQKENVVISIVVVMRSEVVIKKEVDIRFTMHHFEEREQVLISQIKRART